MPKVPYSAVIRCSEAYDRVRSRYARRGTSLSGLPEQHRNWGHFVRTADAIEQAGAGETDWIEAQFLNATASSFPYPNQLYSKAALERWEIYSSSLDVDKLLEQMYATMNRYMILSNRTEQEVVEDELLTEFYPWFIALYADPLTKELASSLRAALAHRGIRKALSELNDSRGIPVYRLDDLERRVSEVIE